MSDQVLSQLIIFQIGSEKFVLDIAPMVEIISYRSPTPVPRSPSFIEGIIILRSQVVPVIDLRQRLLPDETGEKGNPKILILRMSGQVVGFKVDGVHRIITVERGDILPPPPRLGGLDVSFLKGVVHKEDMVYLYLDTGRLLSPGEIDLLRQNSKLEKQPGEE